MLFWQEINLHLQEWLQPNDHICLLLIKSQKRLCSPITSLLSPLSFAEEAGTTLRAGDRIPSPSKHFFSVQRSVWAVLSWCWLPVLNSQFRPSSALSCACPAPGAAWAGWVWACSSTEFGLSPSLRHCWKCTGVSWKATGNSFWKEPHSSGLIKMTVSFLRLSSGLEVKEDGRVKGK